MSISHLFPIDKWDFKTHSILTGLPPEEINLLMAHTTVHQYARNDTVFREGTVPSGIFFIRNGKVKKYKTDKFGREQIIYLANTGEIIGYHALLSEERYPDTAAALEESTITFIPKEDFLQAIERSKVLSQRLLKMLSHEYTVFANSVATLAHRSVRERLAMQLVVLREKYKENYQPGMLVEINLSRDDLAGLVGTARENIVRILKEFREEGMIETKGRKIFVTDVHKLLQASNY